MKILNYLAITLISIMITGCGPDKSPAPKLFEEQRNALDKAKTVETTVQQQNQDLQQNVEKQTQ
jgi:hypothetical protein